jgi:predicted RNA-binding Zn ribbon-like protein
MSEPKIDDGYRFDLTGGHAALDFTNTASRRSDPAENVEYLTDYGRLVSFAQQTGLISPVEAHRLRAEAEAHPRAAAAALRRAVELREAIYPLLSAEARGEPLPDGALDGLNAALPEALGALRLEPGSDGFRWSFRHEKTDLAPMLAPLLRSTAELLTSGDLARVRECDSDTCFWLFLDTSKSGTRRWCDMKVCGNREKARRHHRRSKAEARSE